MKTHQIEISCIQEDAVIKGVLEYKTYGIIEILKGLPKIKNWKDLKKIYSRTKKISNWQDLKLFLDQYTEVELKNADMFAGNSRLVHSSKKIFKIHSSREDWYGLMVY